MMTTADKLAYTRNAKKEIKNALIEKGVEVLDTDTFASYSEKIRNIPAGGGDTVYAVSETALNVDDKVYLNKHYYDSYEVSEYKTGWKESAYSKYVYCYNNGDLITFNNGTYCTHYSYDSENKTWAVREFTKTSGGTIIGVENLDGTIVTRTAKDFSSVCDQFIFKTKTTDISGKILRKDLALQYAASKQFNLVEIVNPETGELGQTYSTVNYSYTQKIYTAKLIGNILFFTLNGGYYFFYDISDVTAPVLLKSGTCEISSLTAATGFTVGDYVFGIDDIDGNYLTASQLTYCYKIADDYSLITADDLPSEFYNYLGKASSTFYFNAENNTLSVGDDTSVSLYKYKDKTFKKISYNIPVPTEFTLDTGYGYVLFVSEDLSTAVIAGRRSGSGSNDYGDSKAYKMVNNNDNWYAEDYIHSNALSLQGFATGNTNDEGLYEISTVLPKKINLTINTNVDTVVEMRGDVE